MKVPLPDGSYKYSLPADQRFNPMQKLQRALTDAFVSIDGASHFLVMKTLPGNAHAIGFLNRSSGLDRNTRNNMWR